MEIMLFIVLALFVLSGIDALFFAPRRTPVGSTRSARPAQRAPQRYAGRPSARSLPVCTSRTRSNVVAQRLCRQ